MPPKPSPAVPVYLGPSDAVDVYVGGTYVTVARGEAAPEGVDPATLGPDWGAPIPSED